MRKGERGELVQRIKTIRVRRDCFLYIYGSGQWGISQERGSKISEGIVGVEVG